MNTTLPINEPTGLGRNTITGQHRVDSDWLINQMLYGTDYADKRDMRIPRTIPQERANHKREINRLRATLPLFLK